MLFIKWIECTCTADFISIYLLSVSQRLRHTYISLSGVVELHWKKIEMKFHFAWKWGNNIHWIFVFECTPHSLISPMRRFLPLLRRLAPGFSWVIPPAWQPSAARSLYIYARRRRHIRGGISHSTFTWCHKFTFMVLRNFIIEMSNELTKPTHLKSRPFHEEWRAI